MSQYQVKEVLMIAYFSNNPMQKLTAAIEINLPTKLLKT